VVAPARREPRVSPQDPATPRRALVTGASRGIGRAIALALARSGLEVCVNYRADEEAAAETLSAIHALGGKATGLRCDVADREACRERLEEELARSGPFWGVVCNAGIHADAAFPSLSAEAWDSVLRTNLDGFYNVLRPLVMPMVRMHQGGRIVVLSSVAALAGNRGQTNYAASKAGLIGAAKSLALELAKRKITVNAVVPGLIETEMVEGLPVAELARLIPMQRLGRPDEVAATVAFQFSEGAGYITGHAISVNGGMR
jgi:3-oxoacyl-[acyl-carrier protein] reductase